MPDFHEEYKNFPYVKYYDEDNIYLDNSDINDLIKDIKLRIDIHPDDETYDIFIKDYIKENLKKFSRFPLPIFQNNYHEQSYTKIDSYNYLAPDFHKLINFISRIHKVYFFHNEQKINEHNNMFNIEIIEKKELCRAFEKQEDYSLVKWRIFDHIGIPNKYSISKDRILYDKNILMRDKKSTVYIIGLLYNGLPAYHRYFLDDCRHLLILAVLRDLYREVLKSPELFNSVDTLFAEEYDNLSKKDLSYYPKILKRDRSYW